MFPEDNHIQKKSKKQKRLIFLLISFVAIGLVVLFYGMSLLKPVRIEQPITITIPEGYSLIQTAHFLENQSLIRSALAFRLLGQSQDISIKAGTYLFEDNVSLQYLLERLDQSDYGDVYVSLTIPEGSTIDQIKAIILDQNFEKFNSNEFDQVTLEKEGYLFPDTYNFLPTASTETIVQKLSDTFEIKTESLKKQLPINRSWEDIIIMASLIEKEATGNFQEKQTVSGILWKRLDEGKLLQVDAPFQYINGMVNAKDLRIDGPYNTYTRSGLTPTPIGNPGIDSIKAALDPIASSYYFYLHAPDGGIHYGKTYRDHVNNINRYLR